MDNQNAEVQGSKMKAKEQEVAEELDRLEEEYRTVPENRQIIGRGPEAIREHLRMTGAKQQLTIRLDADIIERFKELDGVDYQTLINRALQEWLETLDEI